MDKPAVQAPGATDKVRKAARQLAYDVRYKVKGQFKDGQKTDPASLKRAYMQQLGKSPAPGPVKALAKKMLIGEEYDFVNLDDAASDAVLSVFEKIFEGAEGTKYTVRVKDKKTGRSYLRKADRAKIAELRKNPNISSVEIAGKGAAEPDTYDKTGKGKKADKDYDGDGKIESGTAEYMGSRDKAIKKAMAKEEFIVAEGEEKEKKLDVMKGKNKVVVNPPMNEQQSAMDKPKTGPSPEEKRQLDNKKKMLQKKMMLQRQTMQMQKQGRLPLNYSEEAGKVCDKCGQEPCVCSDKKVDAPSDSRGSYAMMNLIKNKLRARGLKMSYEPQGEMTEATEDSLRDRRMERGGVDGNVRYDRPAKNVATGPVDKKKAAESRKRTMDAVRASITAKYGKGAIMDTKKK